MKSRTEALKLMEEFKELAMGKYSVEVCVRFVALQAEIFKRINPDLWNDAEEDAKVGANLSLPETNN